MSTYPTHANDGSELLPGRDIQSHRYEGIDGAPPAGWLDVVDGTYEAPTGRARTWAQFRSAPSSTPWINLRYKDPSGSSGEVIYPEDCRFIGVFINEARYRGGSGDPYLQFNLNSSATNARSGARLRLQSGTGALTLFYYTSPLDSVAEQSIVLRSGGESADTSTGTTESLGLVLENPFTGQGNVWRYRVYQGNQIVRHDSLPSLEMSNPIRGWVVANGLGNDVSDAFSFSSLEFKFGVSLGALT